MIKNGGAQEGVPVGIIGVVDICPSLYWPWAQHTDLGQWSMCGSEINVQWVNEEMYGCMRD